LVSVLAAAVLAAWVVHFVPLIQLLPGVPPLSRQGALSELLLGLALAGLAAGRKRASAFFATIVIILAVLVGFEYILGRNLGIDQLLGGDYLRSVSPPGRISPVGAFCYLSAGLALLAMSIRRLARHAPAIAGTIASVLIAVGSVMFLAYLLGQNAVYVWGPFRGISVQAAVVVVFLGAGIMVLALEECRIRKLMPRWLPLALGLGLSAGALGVWQALIFHEEAQLPLLSHVILGGGILSAFLVAIAIALAQKAMLRSRELHEGKAELETLFEASLEALLVTDRSGRIVSANQRVQGVFGYTREEIVGVQIERLVPIPLRDLHRVHRQSYNAAPRARPMGLGLELHARRKDGSEFAVDVSLSPLQSKGELRVLASVRDITKRKLAQEALRESEERFRGIFEASPLGLALIQMDYRLAKVNAALCRMLGYSEAELMALSPFDLTHPDDRESGRVLAERLFKGEIPFYQSERRYLKKSGETMWAALTATVLYDPEGRPLFGLGMIEDITERKRSEEELRTLSQRLSLAARSALIGVWDWDPRTDLAIWDDRMFQIFGIPKKARVTHEDWTRRIRPDDLATVEARVAAAIDSKTQYEVDFRIVRPDGSLRYVSVAGGPVVDKNGSVTGVVGIALDITERKVAEQKVAEQAALLDLAHDAIFVRSLEGRRITFWSRGAADTYGWTASEVLGRVPDDLLQTKFPIPREEIEAKVRLQGAWEGELEHTTRDGRKLQVASRWSLQRDERGAPVATLEINRDITARKQMEEDLEAVRKQAIRSARLSALGMMAGGIAHEINNPLSIIHAMASDLQEMVAEEGSALPEVVARKSTVIRETAERIAKIVKSLRHISREGSSDLFHPTPVAKILAETLEICRAKFKASGVELLLPQAIPELSVPCREVQIAQALLNLLQNAFDAALEQEGERWVRLEVKPGKGVVSISVIDSGPGIPSEVRSRIGEPFFTTKPVGKGTGLGLSLSKTIAEDHGGSLEYGEDQGHTRFSLVLPLARKAEAA
jgi:PAS domain S-box-containing protein